MNIQIRHANKNDYEPVIRIMSQVQDMHVEWRPDIYKPNENLIPEDVFEKIIENGTFYVAEENGTVVGVLEIVFRHVESPSHVTRDFIFIDSMAIDEKYRGMGIGHQMFDFLKELKKEIEKFDNVSQDIYNQFSRASKLVSLNNPLMQFTVSSIIVLISWFGGKEIVVGGLTTGEFTSMISYAMQILISLMILSMVLVMIIIKIMFIMLLVQ